MRCGGPIRIDNIVAIGYSVEGVYMFNWDEKNEKGVCPSEEDYAHVIDVCQKIGIRYSRAEFVKEYWTDVFRLAIVIVIIEPVQYPHL